MTTPRNVVLCLITNTNARYRRPFEQPTPDELADGLIGLYVQMGYEEVVAEIQASFEAPSGREVVSLGEPDDSPEQVAAELWREMEDRLP